MFCLTETAVPPDVSGEIVACQGDAGAEGEDEGLVGRVGGQRAARPRTTSLAGTGDNKVAVRYGRS